MRTLAMLFVLALLAMPLPAEAQHVYRCRGADGVTLFTDRPCHFHDAVPIAAPERLPGIEVAPGITWHPLDPADDIPDAAIGCPAPHAEALRQRLQQALSRRDLNAMAGLYAWGGASRGYADQVLQQMRQLLDSRAADVRLVPGSLSFQGALPRLQIFRDGDAQWPQASFDVVRGAGCVWLAS